MLNNQQILSVHSSLSGESIYSADFLTDLFLYPSPLAHGEIFTGRPSTSIFSNEHAVAKIRTDIALQPDRADEWCRVRIKREQDLGIYHPDKTWFVVKNDNGLQVGNICPRLHALHQLENKVWLENYSDFMSQYATLYFNAILHDLWRLDEGLSNFGLDEQGTLYYLDDDLYRWDDGVALAYFLCNLIRSQEWIDDKIIAGIGDVFAQACMEITEKTQYVAAILREVSSLYMVRSSDQQKQKILAERLAHRIKLYRKGITSTNKVKPKRHMALLGDIHSNLPAFKTVLAFLEDEHIEDMLVVGDVVGYGPNPDECVELLKERSAIVIAGNHDFVCAGGEVPRGFSPDARWVLDWSRERMSEENLSWLRDLPRVVQQDNWMAVHGAPIDKHYFYAYVYMMTYEENLQYLKDTETRFCFHGHSHIPGVFFKNGSDDYFSDTDIQELSGYHQALICPGSVGQPRCGKPGAEFGIFDRESLQLKLFRLDYDVDPVINRMREEQFPRRLITRLMQGR